MSDDSHVSPTPLDDEGLHCPKCEYNLTGLSDDRCPECGTTFDRRTLRQHAVERRPIPTWPERTLAGNISGFARTLYWTALEPGEFARRFPCRYPPAVVWAHTITCDVIALGVATAVRGLDPATLIFVLSALVTATLVEMVLAVLFSVGIGAGGLPTREHYCFWRGIMHCFGGFLILTIAGWTIISSNFVQSWYVMGEVTLVISVVWWAGALVRCAWVRGQKAQGALDVLGLVIGIALVAGAAVWFAIIVGVFASLMLGLGP